VESTFVSEFLTKLLVTFSVDDFRKLELQSITVSIDKQEIIKNFRTDLEVST
jgi:hypothetical protein